VNEQKIERGLMLLNDLPGIEVKSTLVPGATPGTTDLVIETTEGDVASASVDADNYGNKFTGTARVGATLNASDLSGYGDQATLRAMTSGTGMTYARAAYTLPVGDMGTKAGLAYSKMNYKLGGDFAALNGKGDSGVLSLFAVHPLQRSRNENAYLTASFDNKNLSDDQNGVNVTNKSANVFALGLSGDQRDAFGGGGLNAGSVTLTGGKLNVDGNTNYAANDAITAHSNGNYAKLGFNLSRLQRIDDSWSWYAALSAQHASKNLDSSEKFSLGGTGVRAYPQGEASGDSGALLNIEARYSVPTTDWGNLQLVAFLDTGSITLHQSTWAGWQPSGRPNFPNTYSLSGAGLGLNLYRDADFSVRSAVAFKLGSNPGADALGRDSDGASRSVRFWLQASKQF
jgi:hemolysin activation/secretion protein